MRAKTSYWIEIDTLAVSKVPVTRHVALLDDGTAVNRALEERKPLAMLCVAREGPCNKGIRRVELKTRHTNTRRSH